MDEKKGSGISLSSEILARHGIVTKEDFKKISAKEIKRILRSYDTK